jgi:hypothetical protein
LQTAWRRLQKVLLWLPLLRRSHCCRRLLMSWRMLLWAQQQQHLTSCRLRQHQMQQRWSWLCLWHLGLGLSAAARTTRQTLTP